MKTKKITISGLAFDTYWKTRFFTIGWGEEWDMKRLSEEAKKGWIVTKIEMFHYVLQQQEPQDIQYYIDYQDNPDDDYFAVFQSSGWEKVHSELYMHLFKSPIGTKPPHTDIDTKLMKMMYEMRRFGRYTIIALPVTFVLTWGLDWASRIYYDAFWYPFLIGAVIIAYVASVFTFMPFIGYWRRVAKLKKKKI